MNSEIQIDREVGRRNSPPHRPAAPLPFNGVYGGHTHAIYRFGLKDVLPENIDLIHGPGCPVCVLPIGRIDDGLSIAAEPNVIFAAFGDMMRVPGAHGSPRRFQVRGTCCIKENGHAASSRGSIRNA
jgi:hydrogenase expression/formation protein HypD